MAITNFSFAVSNKGKDMAKNGEPGWRDKVSRQRYNVSRDIPDEIWERIHDGMDLSTEY